MGDKNCKPKKLTIVTSAQNVSQGPGKISDARPRVELHEHSQFADVPLPDTPGPTQSHFQAPHRTHV